MPIGVIINCSAVFLGGILGCFLGKYLPLQTRQRITIIFGFCAIAIGINSVVKAVSMPPIIMSVIIGTSAGDLLNLEQKIINVFNFSLKKLPMPSKSIDIDKYIVAVILFCTSGLGIYGTLLEGMSGNSSVLLSKSVLDFFTSFIFASTMGIAVCIIVLPQLSIMLGLFFIASLISPYISKDMLLDFMACGGILTIAAGLRLSEIKNTRIANMILSLILVMPLSWTWKFFGV